MSSTLYKEALLEVDELKRMAEENAKNKIIDAVTPRIRQLIESQLLNEKKVEDLDEFDELLDDELEDSESVELDLAIPTAITSPPAEVSVAPKIKIDVQGDINIDMETEEDDDELILGQQVSDMVETYIMGKRSPKIRINELARKTKALSALLENRDLNKVTPAQKKIALIYYSKLLDEAVSLASSGIIIEESVDLRLLSQLKHTIKEIRHMANRRDAVAFRRLLEELEADEGLKEMIREEDDESAAEEAAEAVDAAEEVEADVDAAADAAEDIQAAASDLLAALGLDDEVEVEEEEVEVGDDEVEDTDEEVLELGETDHNEADDVDEIYEIDETMLRRELLRMKEGLEAEEGDPGQTTIQKCWRSNGCSRCLGWF